MEPSHLVAAAIDCGTNTILLLAGTMEGGRVRVLHDDIEFARLGEGLDASGRISDAAMERGLAAFRRYHALCRELGVSVIRSSGTSALRDAANGRDFIARVRAETGIEIEIIDGVREAKLGFAAATADLARGAGAIVLDVGGGSMQLMTAHAAVSWQLGAVRLTERFFRHDPPEAPEIAACRSHIAREIAPNAPSPAEPFEVYGVSGTCTTLAAVSMGMREYDSERVHGSTLEIARIEALLSEFLRNTSEGRGRMPGLHPKRADVIIAGTLVVLEVLARYGKSVLHVSDRGIRHAILREALEAAAARR